MIYRNGPARLAFALVLLVLAGVLMIFNSFYEAKLQRAETDAVESLKAEYGEGFSIVSIEERQSTEGILGFFGERYWSVTVHSPERSFEYLIGVPDENGDIVWSFDEENDDPIFGVLAE